MSGALLHFAPGCSAEIGSAAAGAGAFERYRIQSTVAVISRKASTADLFGSRRTRVVRLSSCLFTVLLGSRSLPRDHPRLEIRIEPQLDRHIPRRRGGVAVLGKLLADVKLLHPHRPRHLLAAADEAV